MQRPIFLSLHLKKALMNVNSRLREFYPDSEELFDIVLMTNNHAQVGVRLINSINHYGTLHLKPQLLQCICNVMVSAAEALTQNCFYGLFILHRFDHREILYDWREKSHRLSKGLYDKPVPLQRCRESDGGYRGR